MRDTTLVEPKPQVEPTSGRSLTEILSSWDSERHGNELFELASTLYPICRSITGDGVRRSLHALQRFIPLSLHEVPTGTRVFDWSVPKEWNIRDAWIKNPRGEKIVDFQISNLHVLNYSAPVKKVLALSELRQHLFTLPEHPDWIPYRTSYYKESWGFCISQSLLNTLQEGDYEVCIDSTLDPGHLTYGELVLKGASPAEVLISAHSCHPSLANDNLSGMVVAAKVAQELSQLSLRYTYRFVWIPGTIGSITWLALNEANIPNIKHGLVLSCLGDRGHFTYKRSRHGDAEIDRIVASFLRASAEKYELLDFSPYGYDERQYCSPGINLPVGCFMRTPNGKYPEYHTSGDNLNFISAESLADSAATLLSIIHSLEANRSYVNLNPKCEPQLGRRGLYRAMGGTSSTNLEEAMLWVLNFSDGRHSLLAIAERSGIPLASLSSAAELLLNHDLLQESGGAREGRAPASPNPVSSKQNRGTSSGESKIQDPESSI